MIDEFAALRRHALALPDDDPAKAGLVSLLDLVATLPQRLPGWLDEAVTLARASVGAGDPDLALLSQAVLVLVLAGMEARYG